MSSEDVIIIGSGPSGLACAAALRRAGIDPLVLEKAAAVAASWRNRPDGLTLIAGRRASAMPGTRFRRGTAAFPTRDQLVEHLEDFAHKHRLRVRTGVTVQRVDRDGDEWVVQSPHQALKARHVVVATGLFSQPVIPPWPGRQLLGDRLIHAADYRRPQPYVGKAVLVVGAGTTGVEIASELVSHGAKSVRLSVRTPPNLIPRLLGVLPGLKLILKLPDRIGDAQMRMLRRVFIGDLSAQGLEIPPDGPFATVTKRHTTPTNIGRHCVAAIRDGRIQVVPAVNSVHEHGVKLVDGTSLEVDVVIAATGYTSGLQALVGHLDVLDHRGEPRRFVPTGVKAGLHFAGFENVPGQLAFCGQAAKRVTKEITSDPRIRQLAAR